MSIITLNLLEPNASFTRQANQKRERQKKIICIFGFLLAWSLLFLFHVWFIPEVLGIWLFTSSGAF
jgi:hypothetical protein